MNIWQRLFGRSTPEHAYELAALVTEEGRGVVVKRTADGQGLSWRTLPWGDGLESLPVVGTKYHPKALNSKEFGPCKPVCLVPEPDNKYDQNAIAVWSADRQLHVGYIPSENTARLHKEIAAGRQFRCIVMWETTTARQRRVGLRILIIADRADLDLELDEIPLSPG